MSITYALAQTIRDTIDADVNARTYLNDGAPQGTDELFLERVDRVRESEVLALQDDSKTELVKVKCVGSESIVLCDTLQGTFGAGEAYVQRTYGCRLVDTIIIGNPETLSSYPAITVEAISMLQEPLTLESVTEQYDYDVTVWTDATNHDMAIAALYQLSDAVQVALFRELYPVVPPYAQTTLREPTMPSDTAIYVNSTQKLRASIIIEGDDGTRRLNRATKIEQAGVITLAFAVGASFDKGARVISPLIGTYDPRVEGVAYNDSRDQDKLLKASTIRYSLKVQRMRDKRTVR